jgi:hypothetical protein
VSACRTTSTSQIPELDRVVGDDLLPLVFGTFTKSSSMTLREYGQSLPWCGKSVDHDMFDTPTW